jgi:hypothetical protein
MGAAAIPVLIMAATTAYSAYSSVQAGKAEKRADDKAADRAEKAAGLEAADTEKLHRRIIASQEARYGAAGLTMEGSPLLVQQEALTESRAQLERIAEGGGYVSGVYKSAGEEAVDAGEAGAIQSLLSGANSTYTAGANYNWW